MTREEFKAVCMKHHTVVAGYEFADRFDFDAIYGECGFDSAREREQAIEAAAYRKAAIALDTCLKHVDYTRERKDGAVTVTPLTIDVTEALNVIQALITPSAQSALDEMIAELKAQTAAMLEKAAGRIWDDWDTPISQLDSAWLAGAIEERIRALITADQAAALADREKRARETALRALLGVRSVVEFYLEREINAPANHQEFAREAQGKLDAFHAAMALLDAPGSPSPRLYTEAEVTERVREEAEACAQILDNGRFLTGDSNEKKWAVQVAGLIRKRATAGAPVPESVQGKSEGKK